MDGCVDEERGAMRVDSVAACDLSEPGVASLRVGNGVIPDSGSLSVLAGFPLP